MRAVRKEKRRKKNRRNLPHQGAAKENLVPEGGRKWWASRDTLPEAAELFASATE